jgi:hypothetical protein
MTLTVEVTAEFTKLVQAALAEMCGCQSVAVDPGTGRVIVGPMTCSCYCDHKAGCNLLSDLMTDPREIPIQFSEYSSGYDAGVVWWYTRNVDFGDLDVCGGTLELASIQLAHELVHARLDSTNEDDAVRGENQVRMERCLPMRMEYINETVADFRVGVLDASNRPEYGCECSVLRGGLCPSLKRWVCVFHSMYCFPMSFGGLWTLWSNKGTQVPRSNFGSGGSTPIPLRITQALKVRTRIPLAAQVDHSHPLLPAAEWEITLESIGLDGLYRALVIAVKSAEVRMLTNFTLRPNGAMPYLSAPGSSLMLSEVVSPPLADKISALLSRLQFTDGAGGATSAADGTVTFLKIRHGTREVSTQLYFYQYPATANHWVKPDGIDAPRWDAINTVYEIWRDIATNPALTIP